MRRWPFQLRITSGVIFSRLTRPTFASLSNSDKLKVRVSPFSRRRINQAGQVGNSERLENSFPTGTVVV